MKRSLMTHDKNQDNVRSVIELVAGVLGISEDELSLDSSIDNPPAWDSLEHMHICLAFERHFSRKLNMDDIITATSIRALVALIP
jgi:acyl carrier protein